MHKHSYEVEQDFWEWEAAVTDTERYHEMLKSLP
jgi:asparagine synthetase A